MFLVSAHLSILESVAVQLIVYVYQLFILIVLEQCVLSILCMVGTIDMSELVLISNQFVDGLFYTWYFNPIVLYSFMWAVS